MPHILIVDPEREWYRDFWQFRKTIGAGGLALLAEFGGSIAFWVWGHWHIGVPLLIAGILVAAAGGSWVFALRKVRVRRIKSDEQIHLFCHNLRDRTAAIVACTDAIACKHLLEEFNKEAVRGVAEFYCERKGCTSYDSAIRLAARVDNDEVYITRARSGGLSAAREATSQPIPANSGLAKALRDKGYHGVFIVPDIDEAIREGLWHYTPNDSLDDIKTVMVAPINSFENCTKSMFGLLYVTFPQKGANAFYPADTVPLKSFADFLGLVYPIVISKMESLSKQGVANG